MRDKLTYFVLGMLAAFTGAVLAQNPTIFTAIRVNSTSDLRGNVSNGAGNLTLADTVSVTGQILAPDGIDATPSYSFTSNPDAGLWSSGADELVLSVQGFTGGSVSLVGVNAALGGGTGGIVQLVADGNIQLDATGDVLSSASIFTDGSFESTGNGAASAAKFTFSGDEDTGLYRIGANQLGVTAGNGLRLTADTSGISIPDLTVTGTTMTVNSNISTDNSSASEVGYKGIPQNSQSGNYTLVLGDAATHIYHPSGGGAGDTFTIPANASVAYPVGTVVTFINDDSNSISVAITSDTMTLAGTTTTGTRTLAENGIATAIKVTSTTWIINGTAITAVFEPLTPLNDGYYDLRAAA